MAKLRAASGVRIGSAPVGHTGYIQSRVSAYLLDLKEPRIIPGYENEDLDVAFARGEVDAQVASTGTVIEHDLVNKKLVNFHAAIEVPKGRKDSRFAHLNLPDIEEFAKTDKEKKLLNMMRGFRSIGRSTPATGNSEGSCRHSQGGGAKNPYRSGLHQRISEAHRWR